MPVTKRPQGHYSPDSYQDDETSPPPSPVLSWSRVPLGLVVTPSSISSHNNTMAMHETVSPQLPALPEMTSILAPLSSPPPITDPVLSAADNEMDDTMEVLPSEGYDPSWTNVPVYILDEQLHDVAAAWPAPSGHPLPPESLSLAPLSPPQHAESTLSPHSHPAPTHFSPGVIPEVSFGDFDMYANRGSFSILF